ncbi:tRNA pseudouridine(55) synthase TruB [Bifidobacterium sp. ESL0732]|uniref:tRNA pseudouridine synthase B n=1 Tax=Bifidobacterium sp. ESL0732 TaxID=2983222 RepID=UPI0023F9F37C|nr:tRNA pseudouridine(55) synthase TruB [Bifidobacterium sp. ESL0732]WEV64459.1 tRNA pseudouridine(55) synthase TruB [Bifidobacterium sp. ESL0732]
MSKKSKQPEFSGLVVVDKPLGVTSHDVVAAVRGALHMRRVGHAGTLDPQASGVLVIGFGHGTRLLNYIVDHTKTYEATIRLGQTSTTDDLEGDITTVASVRLADGSSQYLGSGQHSGMGNVRALTLRQIEQTIKEHLTGEIEQVPSSYSAVRVNGRHAYELARQGKEVELDARPVTISEFTVLSAHNVEAVNNENEMTASVAPIVDVDVRISCSTGTYIRSLGRDLGELLGVGGYLTRLRRTRVGKFDLTDPQLADRVVTAHPEPHTFTNREGITLTLNRAVLDVDADELKRRSLTMLEAAQRTMPVLPITQHDAAELRYGRRLKMNLTQAVGKAPEIVEANGDTAKVSGDVVTSTARSASPIQFAAAYVPEIGDVVAILETANAHEVKSALVFPERQ